MSSVPGKLVDGIKGLLGGDWAGAFGNLGSAFVDVIKSFWNDSPLGIIHKFAAGGMIDGPMVAVLGEAGEREMVVPQHYFKYLAPQMFDVIPGAAPYKPSTKMTTGGGGTVSAASTTQTREAAQYNAYVSVDSENMVRKVFKAFQANEDYNMLRYRGL